MVERLLSQIEPATVDDELENKLRWNETEDGVFIVKSMYQALKPRNAEFFLWLIWKSGMQLKICFFTWEVT